MSKPQFNYDYETTSKKTPCQKWGVAQLFGCILCHYKTSRKSNLLKHLMTHTKEKPFKCYNCNFCAATKNTLVLHVRTHTGEKPYECAICQRKFSRKNIIKSHVKTHTNDKPFKCSECDFVTSRKDNLNFHMRRHLVEKPFKCHFCTSSFVQKCRLHRHIELHTKLFRCTSCCFQTHLEMNLLKHKLSHYDINCVICYLCGKEFGKKSALTIHIRNLHPNKKCKQNRYTNTEIHASLKNDENALNTNNSNKTYIDKAISTDDIIDNAIFAPLQNNTVYLNNNNNSISSDHNIGMASNNLIHVQINASEVHSDLNGCDLDSSFGLKPGMPNELESNFVNMDLNSNPTVSETFNSNFENVRNLDDAMNNLGYTSYDYNFPAVDDDSNIESSSSESESPESNLGSSSYNPNVVNEYFVEQNCVQNVSYVNPDLIVNQQHNINYLYGINFMQPLIIPTVSLQPNFNSNVVLTTNFNNVQVNQEVSFVPTCSNTNLFLNNLVPSVVDPNLMLNPTKQIYVTEMF